MIAAAQKRRTMLASGQLTRLPDVSHAAAGRAYVDTILKLCDGLEAVLWAHEKTLGTSARPQ